MADLAADYYEKLFVEPTVYRPHPYLDLQRPIEWENESEVIPLITFPELIKVVNSMKAKHSCDAHGISPHMLQFIPLEFWSLLLKLFNKTFIDFELVSFWKEVRIILLAKKEAVCAVSGTRPISLLDTFLKVLERLFLVRFQIILQGRGILPDTQSGFRPGFRLQTRVLTLVEQISSYMANSAPVATVFVDFKSAFDQLWWEGCIGKLAQLGIPRSYRQWIVTWLKGRRAFLEVNGSRSRWFNVCRGGPQGSCFMPTLFITYHADMWTSIMNCLSNCFADDLACVLAGQMGIKYSKQPIMTCFLYGYRQYVSPIPQQQHDLHKPSFLNDQELKYLLVESCDAFLFALNSENLRVIYINFVHPDDVEKVREQLNLQPQDGSPNGNGNGRVLDLKTGIVKKDGHATGARLGKFLD
ncbi:unnamed protein product [Didymodactylos carnosus]|uniref:Reverse transcriptase domain-containing protein n=2 Tax=Didymodactylos carnosus TaxID=1234261 RepID=A0A8S2E7T9_9BILA|nr:unnamed protein product [Didymodactylos carnosus]CAF3920579.1 unnamed protein product [Didymodactylos carnosus]